MKKIIAPRGSGKTRKTLEYAKKHNAMVACANPYAMREKAKAYGIIGVECIPYTYVLEGFIKKDIAVCIDDVDSFLKMIPQNIIGYNTCKEDDDTNEEY